MPIIHEEIIEDIEAHIRKSNGACNEWWVGTAKDARAPFFRRHLATDLGDELIYREAFTTSAADAVIDHLVNQCGLRLDRDAVPEPGKIVFVYHRAGDSGLGIRDSGERGAAQGTPQPNPAAPRSDQAGSAELCAFQHYSAALSMMIDAGFKIQEERQRPCQSIMKKLSRTWKTTFGSLAESGASGVWGRRKILAGRFSGGIWRLIWATG